MIEQVKVQIRQPGQPERVMPLTEGAVTLGRAEDNDIVLADVGVSRRHARIIVSKETVRIEDLGSGNGTYYAGFRVQSQVLKDNDEVVLDPFVLTFRIQGQAAGGEELRDASKSPARLEVIVGEGMNASIFPIGPRGVTMGRSENREVIIPDPASSRHHCSVLPRGTDFILRDMGSANGIFVNAVRTRETVLAHGDRIRIGNTELRFMLHDSLVDNTGASSSALSQRNPWLGAAIGGVAALALMGVGVAVAAAGAALLWWPPGESVFPAHAPQPPAFTLALPGGLPPATVEELFEQGIESTRKKESAKAFEAFYRVLQAEPGNTGAERLFYMAGEFVVLDSLEPALASAEVARMSRESERDQMLDRYRKGQRKYAANLKDAFAADRTVQEAMGWGPDPATRAVQEKLASAQRKTAEGAWREAVALYDEGMAAALPNPDLAYLYAEARANSKNSRLELAKQVSVPWRAGVVAIARGREEEARTALASVMALDPAHHSGRTRQAMLDEKKP